MKRVLLSIVAIATISLSSFGQAPESFKYQAVIRDAGNIILNNQAVGMRMTIQQGSIGGTTVYQETFAPTSNAYGLVNLAIGNGTVVSGTFATIDWSNGPYFIETAVDVTGGTSYTVIGTSQLMSVPYALHAKTAENILNDAVDDADSDPTNEMNTGVVLNGTDLEVTDGNGTIVTDLSSLQDIYTAGDGIEIAGTVISETKYQVGDFAQGGVVCYVDETGEHGLVVSKNDLPAIRWFAGTYGRTRADGNGMYAGEANSVIIIGAQLAIGDDSNPYAAARCNEVQITEGATTYSDWYLPTSAELEQIGNNATIINTTSTANGGTTLLTSPYWSSTELNITDANVVVITPGGTSVLSINKAATFEIRAVRRF